MRVDKLISSVGLDSRKNIKKNAKEGFLIINGEIVKDSSKKIDPYKDEIIYNNEIVEYFDNLYIMMNKPKGILSSTLDKEKTVIDLLDFFYRQFNFSIAGRLDKDASGFVLLTTDGKLLHDIITPKNDVEKTYIVETNLPLKEEYINLFKKGIEIKEENYISKPAKIKILEEKRCEVKITEGKFHEVKYMFKNVGNEVTSLKRIKIGKLELDTSLKEGEYRELSDFEIELLKESKNK
ncbi:MAG: pseudouridine synthase [Peptoniphilaceae bacterium]|nr:rRNA pseudouridine synthase [Peptoniphilaceae bacterium]MDD7383041.1 pseudouridine synthase [Peptoniphilaceae bacterium]MDY3737549.1 pseudouridine synthase [Peptoniphilaceae bacterium]